MCLELRILGSAAGSTPTSVCDIGLASQLSWASLFLSIKWSQRALCFPWFVVLISGRSPGEGPQGGAWMSSHRWAGVHGCHVEPRGRPGATVGDTEVPRLASQLVIVSDFSDLTKVGGCLVKEGGGLGEGYGKQGSPCPSPGGSLLCSPCLCFGGVQAQCGQILQFFKRS